jgi:tRNA dimethylallyltransferase
MDIGTAKVTAAERARAPHHGLDLVDPPDAFTAADYRAHALAALEGIHARGNVALMAGGTGLYLRVVARGVPVDMTGHDHELRERLERRLETEGLAALAAELRTAAPETATRTDLGNARRVVRALERVALAGDAPPPEPRGYPAPVLWLGVELDAATHRARVASRAQEQFTAGLIDEAASLRARWGDTPRAFSAIGYREAFAVLDGRMSRAEAVAVDAQRNWAYARRQRTWFRGEPGITWLDGAGDTVAAAWPTVEAFVAR